MTRLPWLRSLALSLSVLVVAPGCGSDSSSSDGDAGGSAGSAPAGGASGTAGSSSGAAGASAGSSAGGTSAGASGAAGKNAGGASAGGTSAGSSGANAGGTSAGASGKNAGGTSAGGTSAGSSAGGTSAGGTSAGGANAGGANAGGTSAGGTSAGGTSAGGKSAGGASGAGGQPGGPGAACSPTEPCQSGLVCASGECVAAHGPCTTDNDCQGDTYCCGDGCKQGGDNACIAYGTGPNGNLNDTCTFKPTPGLFEARVQCEWTAPPAGDPYPNHKQVLVTPLVADLPYDSGAAAEIVVVTFDGLDGGGPSGIGTDGATGVIRVLNGQTCAQLGSIIDPAHRIVPASTPAIGDLDGDGIPEIVTHLAATGGVVAFKWDASLKTYTTWWASAATDLPGTYHWDGPSIHDLDGDGKPEVLSASEVYDGQTGQRLNPGQILYKGGGNGNFAVVADVDGDGTVELIAGPIYRWDASKTWKMAYPGAPALPQYAVADFGTPGATPADFNPNVRDGIAEIVGVGSGRIVLATVEGQILIDLPGGIVGGGPPTIGDFDNDGRPEIASAGGTFYEIVDLDCAVDGTPGCLAPYVRWRQASQDNSSQITASSIFDFEGDGQAEAVYADECFVRAYDGKSGDVLYSAYRTSCTWYENAIVADPDRDSNTEIIVGSNANCGVSCPAIDPIHKGIRCAQNADCQSNSCQGGLCRCDADAACPDGYHCAAPIDNTVGNTCRAYHPPGVGQTGIRVLRDRLDRWVSSRPIWNQHAYSITNINDDGTIPAAGQWKRNFALNGPNNYRQNAQGSAATNTAPDITGKLDPDSLCKVVGNNVELTATVCNRGKKAVGAALPATFYKGDPANKQILCTSFTSGPVPVGGCLEVSCDVPFGVEGQVTMVVNDDGNGGQTTVECNVGNNSDQVTIGSGCKP